MMQASFLELLLISAVMQICFYTLMLTLALKNEAEGISIVDSRIITMASLIPLIAILLFPMLSIESLYKFAVFALISGVLSYETIILKSKCNNPIVRAFPYLLALIPLSTFASIGNSYPSIEEGRYLGFALEIIKRGHWIPFTFHDNDYYQFFHVASSYLAIQLLVTSMDPFVLRKMIALLLSFFILILAKLLYKVYSENHDHIYNSLSNIPLLLVVFSPTLTYLFMIYGNGPLATILALFAITTLINNHLKKSVLLLILSVTSLIGVITHAVYSIYLIPFIAILISASRSRHYRRTYILCLLIVSFITITYWIFSVVFKHIVIKVITDYWRSITNLIVKPLSEHKGYTPWYDYIAPFDRLSLAFSWSFVACLAISIFLVKVFMKGHLIIKEVPNMRYCSIVTLYVISLIGAPLSWYLISKKPPMGLGFGHFYGATFLLIPIAASALYIFMKSRKKCIIVLALLFTGMAIYGAMLDPRYNPTLPALGISGERDWLTGTTIAYFSTYETLKVGDFRLASPMLYEEVLKGELGYRSHNLKTHLLLTVAYDTKGRACIERMYFMQEHEKLKELILSRRYENLNVVYNDGFYMSLLISIAKLSD